MRAWQLVQFGEPLVANDIAEPTPRGKEVLVRVEACGLCHSDVHFHEGHVSLGGEKQVPVTMLGINPPTSLGHEILGTIVAFGEDAGLGEGDVGRSVIVYPWIGCGHCAACRAERDNECPTPQSIGMQVPGGHASKVLVREAKYLVPAEGLDADFAGVLACCGLTAFAALEKLPRRDGWIGIIGSGGLGLMGLAIEKGLRDSKVVVFDVDAGKLAIARDFGADRTENSRELDVDALKADTDGLIGIVDFVGSQATLDLALGLLRNGGTYVDVGLFGATIEMPLALLASRQISIRGSYTGTPAELRTLADHFRADRIRQIPTTLADMEAVNEGLNALANGRVEGRLVLRHSV